MTPRRILLGCGGLLVLVVVFVLGVVLASNVHISFGSQPTNDTPTTQNQPPVSTTPLPTTTNTTPVVVTNNATPSTCTTGCGPTNGTQGQPFPGTATGPAIVEWFGDASCGTFELPAGQTFTWNRANGGRYWNYPNQASVDAAWGTHVTLFNNNSFNQQHACQVGAQPS